MLTLIIGAAASGKSEYAERLVMSLPGQRIYVATMKPSGTVAEERIARHHMLRAGKGFETVERYTDLGHMEVPDGSNILLECLGNLLANEMFSPEEGGPEAALDGILSLNGRCRNLTVVTNEIASGGDDYEEMTMEYIKKLGEIQRKLAEEADRVVEVVCGIPNIFKK